MGIGKFFLSEKFKFILLKEDLDEDWNTLEEYVDERIDKPMIITSDYTEKVEEKLKYLINQIYKKESKEYFLYFISKILEEFVEWSDDYISLQNIKYTLLGFDYTEEEIDTFFYFIKSNQIKKVRSRFKLSIPSFRTRLTKKSFVKWIKDHWQGIGVFATIIGTIIAALTFYILITK